MDDREELGKAGLHETAQPTAAITGAVASTPALNIQKAENGFVLNSYGEYPGSGQSKTLICSSIEAVLEATRKHFA